MRDAMTSLYGLFRITRDVLQQTQPSRRTGTDPPWSIWPSPCRADLAAMQQRLVAYVLGFGRLAQIPNARQIIEGVIGPGVLPAATRVPSQPSRAR